MTLQIKPLTSSFGAEVIDFDPGQIGDSSIRKELRSAFDKHRLLLFRDIVFDAAEQARFGEVFGSHALEPPVPEHLKNPASEANTQYVSNNRPDGILATGEYLYHQDFIFNPEPLRSIMLYAIEVPSAGGETKFRSCADICKSMDEPTRSLAETVRCLHLFDYDFDVSEMGGDDRKLLFPLEKAGPNAPRAWHPLIWRDPHGGDPVAWCVMGGIAAFEGVSFDDGVKLLNNILDRAERVTEYVHQWRVGDAVIWNNLHLQHARTDFNPKEPRTLRRTSLM